VTFYGDCVKIYEDFIPNFGESKGIFTRNKLTVIPHPTYSPDLAPCYYSVSPFQDIIILTTAAIEAECQAVTKTLK
jgi:hypothetical protein